MYKLILALAILWFSSQLIASTKNDVVKISLPNKTAIEIEGVNINKNQIDIEYINENINRFFSFCKTSNVEELMKQAPRELQIKVVKNEFYPYAIVKEGNVFYELNIKEREIPNQIMSSENFSENLYYLQKHQLEFSNEQYTYKIMFDELAQLEYYLTTDVSSVISDIMSEQTKKKSKFIEQLHYNVDKEYGYEMIYQNDKFPTDQIELSLGTGIGNVKNNWVASIEASMAFSFKRKGILKNSYSIHYEWQYDFSEPDKRNINQFMDLGYSRDFSKDPEDSNIYSLKLGYLINKQGNLYKDNTFRISIERPLGKNISIGPQLYFNDFFQDVIPTVTIGIGF